MRKGYETFLWFIDTTSGALQFCGLGDTVQDGTMFSISAVFLSYLPRRILCVSFCIVDETLSRSLSRWRASASRSAFALTISMRK